MTGEGSSDDMDADEAAAGGLAQMRGSQANFFSTPQKRAGSGALQELFYRTGTPGGRAEYLLASPGSQDRPPLGLPSPSGSRGRGGRGGAGPPKSPAGRKGFKARRGKSARGAAGRAAAAAARAAAAAAAAAAGSQGSSGQRGGTVGRAAAAAAAAEGMDLDAHADGHGLGGGMAGLLVSESELLSENDHDYMDAGLHMPGGHAGGVDCIMMLCCRPLTVVLLWSNCQQLGCCHFLHGLWWAACTWFLDRCLLLSGQGCGDLHDTSLSTCSPLHVQCMPQLFSAACLRCIVLCVPQSLAWQRPASAHPTCAPTASTTRPAAWCCWASVALMRRRENPPQPPSCAVCGRRPQRVPQTCPSCCHSHCSQLGAAAGGMGTMGACTAWSVVTGVGGGAARGARRRRRRHPTATGASPSSPLSSSTR
jgi:hypothetical protein